MLSFRFRHAVAGLFVCGLIVCGLGFSLVAASHSAPAESRLMEPPAEPKAHVEQKVERWSGESLDDWQGDPKYWRTEGGAFVGEIPAGQTLNHNTWLVLKDRVLRDFDLQLQVKLTGAPAANSGIQFRCQVDHVDHVSGYQADLDQGATWLGRIYDEHGRALLVERGKRVHISEDGQRQTETFAAAGNYEVLFRQNDWNDYRIVAIGERVSVYINGTLFSELYDQQTDAKDLFGSLAFQLHSGPETKVQFRDIRLETIEVDDSRLGQWKMSPPAEQPKIPGSVPTVDGKALNLGFEDGTLKDWTATGDAFEGQPVNQDGISSRWSDQVSNKAGDYFIGGYEKLGDKGTGTLTSQPFQVTHPYASLLFGGGQSPATRCDVVQWNEGQPGEVLFTTVGQQREQMVRSVLDLRAHQGKSIAIRLVDETPGFWGHLNFDDFRFHDTRPQFVDVARGGRSTFNPLLQHLVPNQAKASAEERGTETTAQMYVPEGFSVDVVAAEPQLHQPMAFTFDRRGRLWVVEGHCYPQKRPAGEGLDRILIFSDENGDGTYETRKTFIEGLNLVSGMQVGHGGVWVGAAPELLFIPDQDHDDQPDGPPEVLLDGFGYADTHETLNSFIWGPDGWLYGNQGVFNASRIGKPGSDDSQRVELNAGVWRYHPVRREFEVFAHGGSNQWGLDYDENGQMFMTHCRSYWGQGSTTHVIQNGHYWNQVNSRYAPFVSATALPFQPGLKNYLLASARYGHGEGGAGKPGSRAVYGGHSHVGTMIYLGDNWPEKYRNHLFTHNLHGHQMNHQINQRSAGGYNTVHAGYDMLLCADPQFIGVDLQYGPDGAVYFSDWYDPRHCHNPDWEQWDRGNGRMYRMKYNDRYEPVQVDYGAASEMELVEAQSHRNAWHARTARLELADRVTQTALDPRTIDGLVALAKNGSTTPIRLNALWTLHVINALPDSLIDTMLQDSDEYLRAWTIQLACENGHASDPRWAELAANDTSLFVRRYLASALPRMSEETAWQVIEQLAAREDALQDRELPSLIWFGLAPRMAADMSRALQLADITPLPVLRDQICWFATKANDDGRAAVAERLNRSEEASRKELVQLFALGIRGMRNLTQPPAWNQVSASLYGSSDPAVRNAANELGAAFGDRQLFLQMQSALLDPETPVAFKKTALRLLDYDAKGNHLEALLANLDTPGLKLQVLPMLKRYSEPKVAAALLKRYAELEENQQAVAMEVLCSRAGWSQQLLDAIEDEKLEKAQLTAFFARQMASLGDTEVNARLEKLWGRLGQSSAERKAEIAELATLYKEAPLWAYNANAGAAHFKQLCATCHQDTEASARIAPRLQGSGSKGIDYIVENVLDPNAVIGQDFQARLILTVEGRVISGLVVEESDSALTIRTATGTETVARDEIDEIKISENSFMPEGLLKTLNQQQKIELLKYLMTL